MMIPRTVVLMRDLSLDILDSLFLAALAEWRWQRCSWVSSSTTLPSTTPMDWFSDETSSEVEDHVVPRSSCEAEMRWRLCCFLTGPTRYSLVPRVSWAVWSPASQRASALSTHSNLLTKSECELRLTFSGGVDSNFACFASASS